MRAAVYEGNRTVQVQSIPVPPVGPGELLVRVEACGICHTDLKKIEYDLLPAPRVYGHETAGTVVAAGRGVAAFAPGDRVVVFHHVPCLDCFYCRRKVYAQCETYKKVGVTAGFEPAGGGFAEYVRVMDWIVARGVEKIPDGVPFDRACFVEPLNTCLKAVVQLDPQPGDTVAVLGQGPIGLLFTMLLHRRGVAAYATDTLPFRRELSVRCGAREAWDPRADDLRRLLCERTEGRGADQVIIAASAPGIVEQAVACSRPGARILLFAQTSDRERIELSGGSICKEERALIGCYSASIDLQSEAASLVFSGQLPIEALISHRIGLEEIGRGFRMALRPDGQSMKIIVRPQRCSQ
jgi:L-iditol 2-dehydrogenase